MGKRNLKLDTDQIDHVFFDLDHTLWDFDRNSSETLTELFHKYKLDEIGNGSLPYFLRKYSEVNQKLWKDYNRGKVSKADLRIKRFSEVLNSIGVRDSVLVKDIDDEYISTCPKKPHLIEGTIALLDYLKHKYIIHVITNGFKETSFHKVNSSGIAPYIQNLITSEDVGYTKPNAAVFHYAFNKTGADNRNSVMIGDNYSTDILGAKRINMPHIFFNTSYLDFKYKVDIEVRKLEDIHHIL